MNIPPIHEPATLLTDYAISVTGFYLGWRLRKRLQPGQTAARWWSWSLILTAASSVLGGSDHGFGPDLPPAADHALWLASLIGLNLMSATMLVSLLYEIEKPERRRFWYPVVVIKMLIFVALECGNPAFFWVIGDYGSTLILWLIAALVVRRSWSGWMILGICLSVISAVVQQSGWDISPKFNHNDLYHVIEILAMVGFYRAGCRLGLRTA
ncbi:MAG TPA: hypothetical protein VK737_11935 [Opitutales bacterium]|jgi:hypothetical protein|nr:hypothetical protein [Opitutales bacterium]